MTNFGAKILNNARGALSAQQAVIATLGNNIANVNTPGYARRVVDLQTRGTGGTSTGLNVGNGVQIGDIQRIADEFVERMLREAQSTQGSTTIEHDFLKRLEGLFSVSSDQPTIGSTLSDFFTAINDLTADPSSIELRANVMQRAEDLVTSIRSTYTAIADLQTEADTRLGSEIDNINSLTAQIAELNGLISQREQTGTTAGDERDRRAVLLNQLSEKISINVVEASDSSVTISLSNGFALVNGTNSRNIELTNNPSFSVNGMPPSLGGGILRHIVYDYDPSAGTSHLDLTQAIKGGEGSVAGLLKIRGYNAPDGTNTAFMADGILVEMAGRVEALTRTLLTEFNAEYRGPDESPIASPLVTQGSAADLDGNVPGVFGFFTWDNAIAGADTDADGVAEVTDIDNPAQGVDNFSSILRLVFTDPRQFAAARDSDTATEGVTSFEVGNGHNAEALAALQNRQILFNTPANYTQTTTLAGLFSESVTHVGNAKARAQLDESVARSNFLTIQSRRDEISGVSLDEEFTALVRFQKAYQASARMISVADDLLTQIIQLI